MTGTSAPDTSVDTSVQNPDTSAKKGASTQDTSAQEGTSIGGTSAPSVRAGAALRRLVVVYLRPQLGIILLGALINIVAAAALSAQPWLVRELFNAPERLANIRVLVIFCAVCFSAIVLHALAAYGGALLSQMATQRASLHVRNDLTAAMLAAPYAKSGTLHSGRLTAAYTNEVGRLQAAMGAAFIALTRESISAIALAITIMVLDWRLGLTALIGLPLLVGLVRNQIRAMAGRVAQDIDAHAMLSEDASDLARGMRETLAFSRQALLRQRMAGRADAVRRAAERVARLQARVSPISEVVMGLGSIAMLAVAARAIAAGTMTSADLFAFFTAVGLFYRPVRALSQIQVNLRQGIAAAQGLFGLMNLAAPKDDTKDTNSPAFTLTDGTIRFDNVRFAYGDVPALRGLTLTIPGGAKVAIVGASGSGKSTMIDILLRLHNPLGGKVTIDDQNLRDLPVDTTRASCALVPQTPFLLNLSLADNIAFAKPDAALQDIERCARLAGLGALMDDPTRDGLNLLVGENGRNLSGGQRQRVAFARVLLRDARILLLDEPTSQLDAESEAAVFQALDTIGAGKTCVLVAHRLAAARWADRIYLLADGRLAEEGDHPTLLAQGGAYARLWRASMGDAAA